MDFLSLKNEHMKMFDETNKSQAQLELITVEIISALKRGNKLLVCGNGGSAADAQHFAAEIIGRFEVNSRPALPAIALSTDSSVLTAIGNDFGFEYIFSRQVSALCEAGDILIGLTTSGKSQNIVLACDAAIAKGGTAVIFTGEQSAATNLEKLFQLNAPSDKTARVQEFHIFCVHCICSAIDSEFNNG
jgi:D-sedoheptulose 7-phosphate isomerase